MPQLKMMGAKAASKARRSVLGLLMKLPGSGKADPAALLSRFPDESLLPLRRDGLDPVAELTRLSATEPVSRLKMPLGLRGWLITGYEESRTVLAADAEHVQQRLRPHDRQGRHRRRAGSGRPRASPTRPRTPGCGTC